MRGTTVFYHGSARRFNPKVTRFVFPVQQRLKGSLRADALAPSKETWTASRQETKQSSACSLLERLCEKS